MGTGYLYHELYGWHDTGTHAGLLPADPRRGLQPHRHFENAEAKRRVHELVVASGLIDRVVRVRPRPATDEEILRVHSAGHLARLVAGNADGGDAGDGASPFGPGGLDIARLAAGGATVIVESVVDGAIANGYALVRPPGHHAVREHGMGFCLLANAAIAVAAVRASRGVRRVAVVDIDVHHGNGTQALFESDPEVLTVSVHQDRVFPPDSGHRTERGTGTGHGSALNVPLPPGTGNGGYLAAVERVVVPALRRFRPELIVVAAGYDAGATDPLARMMVTAAGFRAIATALLNAADTLCGGRIAFTHEGGYDPVYVPFCAHAVIEALAGVDDPLPDPFSANFDGLAGHDLQPHQDDAISLAERLLTDVPTA